MLTLEFYNSKPPLSPNPEGLHARKADPHPGGEAPTRGRRPNGLIERGSSFSLLRWGWIQKLSSPEVVPFIRRLQGSLQYPTGRTENGIIFE